MASQKIKQALPRRARNSLSRDVILDAAQGLARSGEEISLRAVASFLECSPMALYRHFTDKQGLLLGLLDRVIGSIDMGDDNQPWDERLLDLSKQHLRVLQRNPWAIPLLFQHPDPGPAVRKIGEAMLAALREGGASGARAVSAFSSILALNYGWAGFTATMPDSLGQSLLASRLQTAPRPEDQLNVTSELWGEFQNLGSEVHHELAIRKLVSNLS